MISPPKIIFEDKDILVINKPPNLVVTKDETTSAPTLEDWLAEQFPKISLDRKGIVHRLDKDTSGVLVVAKTRRTLENLQSQFRERKTKKEYLALVHGLLEKGGVVEGAIGRNPRNREKFTVYAKGVYVTHPKGVQGGKEALTEYEPVDNFKIQSEKLKVWFPDFNNIQMLKLERQNYGEFTLLKCFPLTGRTHQIRVHLKYIAHPIVGDEKYVGRKMYRLDKRWCPRQFLHAKRLGFYHPDSGKWVEFESELPGDLEKALGNLESRIQN